MLSGRFQPPKLGDMSMEMDQLVGAAATAEPQHEPGRGLRCGGEPGARAGSLEATNTGGAGGGTERDWIVALPEQGGTLRYVIFVAPDADFPALRPIYERMLRTLKLTRNKCSRNNPLERVFSTARSSFSTVARVCVTGGVPVVSELLLVSELSAIRYRLYRKQNLGTLTNSRKEAGFEIG